jgi:tRNA(Ile)-lysidine synthase
VGGKGTSALALHRDLDVDLLPTRKRILVAFSGGADSTALAIRIWHAGRDVILGHIDHGMQPESGRDAEHCVRLARSFGLRIFVDKVKVDPPCEAEARRVRYDALEAMADRVGADLIATGHTLEDNAETVLMRMMRGGAPVGILLRRGRIVRPMLRLRRAQSQAVCRSARASWIEDPSNSDETILRNFIRRRILPFIDDEAIVALAQKGSEMAEIADDVRFEATRATSELVRRVPGGVEIDRAGLGKLSPAISGAVLRGVLEGAGASPTQRLIIDIQDKLVPSDDCRLDVGEGLRLVSDEDFLVLEPVPPEIPTVPALPEVAVAIPGTVFSDAWDVEVEVEEVDPAEIDQDEIKIWWPREVLIDADAISGGLRMRSRLDGDRFSPLGLGGTRKLQDMLVDLKIPRGLRESVPVVVDDDKIVVAVGVQIDDSVKVTPRTQRILRLYFRGEIPSFRNFVKWGKRA